MSTDNEGSGALPGSTVRGSLFGSGRPDSGVDVSRGVEGARARADGLDVLFGFADARMSLGGTDDDLLVLERAEGQGKLTLYVPLAWALANLPAGAPPDVRTALENLAAEGRRSGRRTVLVFAGFVLVCVLGAWLAWKGLDILIARAVDGIPPEWEANLGKAVAARITARSKVVEDPRILGPVRAITDRLVAGLGRSPYRFHVQVVKDATVNAMAAPGGAIVVLTGLLDEADGPGEVAGVLAHEVQHVVQRHGLRNIVQSLKLRLALSLLVGDATGMQEQILMQAGELAELAYGRDAERQADQEGVRLLHRSGMDPGGMARFFEKLDRKVGGALAERLAFLTTHPGHRERVATTEALTKELGPPKGEPLSVDWALLKKALKEI